MLSRSLEVVVKSEHSVHDEERGGRCSHAVNAALCLLIASHRVRSAYRRVDHSDLYHIVFGISAIVVINRSVLTSALRGIGIRVVRLLYHRIALDIVLSVGKLGNDRRGLGLRKIIGEEGGYLRKLPTPLVVSLTPRYVAVVGASAVVALYLLP